MIPWVFLFLVAGTQPADTLQSHRNLGKAYYEQGEYALAVEELEKVLSFEGARGRDYFNAGMAYLQNQQEDHALAAFETARQMEPGLLEVDFGLGVLQKRAQRYPLALQSFTKVAERDPEDPCTWFNIGSVSFSMHHLDEAEAAFRRVLDLGHARAQNFYVSALFRTASLLARRGAQAEAQKYFAEFQTLREATPNVSLTPTALENGRYGRVEAPRSPEPAPAEAPTIALSELEEVPVTACDREPALALGDFDGDGRTDVFVGSPCGASHLFRNLGGGKLEDVTGARGLASSRKVAGALFLDFENSAAPALYTWGEDGHRFFQNHDGSFQDVTDSAGLSSVSPPTAAILLDYDDDGQIDVLLGRSAEGASPLTLLRNDGDGTFRAIDAGLGAFETGAKGLAAADFDQDGFVDVFVVAETGAKVLNNEGGESFSIRDVAGAGTLRGRLPARVETSDLDHDGWTDVIALDETGWAVFWNRRGRLEAAASPGPSLSASVGDEERWLVPLEVPGSGARSYLVREEGGGFRRLFHQGERRLASAKVELAPGTSGLAVAADLDGREAVLVAGKDGRLRILGVRPEGEAGAHFLRVSLRGKKSNRQGVGAVVELKAGRFYRREVYPGRAVALDIENHDRLDVVRITWTGGVIQNLVDVGGGELEIEEEDRQTSSCPFLYLWDGERFRFLTDIVGRAPLGEWSPDPSGVTPNPDDYLRIPPGAMKPKDGRFVFQLTEELQETAYIDAVELVAVDHPQGVSVYADEKFSTPPFEPFRLYPVRERMEPLEALNDEGIDLLPRLRRADGEYVAISRHRIAGFASEHALILRPPAMDEERLKLFLRGWVYWPSSSSMKAVSTNDSFVPCPPSLQVKDRKGRWVTVVNDIGLPSGIDRTLVVDLSGVFLSPDRRLRVASNFAVYWDEAFFATSSPGDGLDPVFLEPASAELHYRGFSAVENRDSSEPEHYDYQRLLPAAPWNAARGLYTRYGDVTALVSRDDAGLVVMAPGDEMSLAFDEEGLAPPGNGLVRDYFLHVRGWAKDQDPNTRFSKTVDPLPGFGGTSGDGRVRRVPALVVPLAPPGSRHETSR